MRYFFLEESFEVAGLEDDALDCAPLPRRPWSSRANAPISAELVSELSRKDTSVFCREVGDFDELAVARTKSMTVGSDAPVRRIRESETYVLLSIVSDLVFGSFCGKLV
jgi:hypothetical protein